MIDNDYHENRAGLWVGQGRLEGSESKTNGRSVETGKATTEVERQQKQNHWQSDRNWT